MNTAELDASLLKQLAALGLNERTYRAISLLPLVEVAWADGGIQPRERTLILDIARGHNLLPADAESVVQGWLASRPDEAAFAAGRELLVRLAFRKRGLGTEVPKHAVESVVDFCTLVAESAGGLFDMYWTVNTDERRAIRLIAEHLAELSKEADPYLGIVGHSLSPEWVRVADELGSVEED